MHLRSYHPGEETTLWELVHGVGARVASSRAQMDWSHWKADLQVHRPFIVEYDHQVVGYVDLDQDGVIGHLFVRSAWQGRGVGALLMHKVVQQALEQGASQLRAQVSREALPFFTHWGFVPLAECDAPGRGGDLLMCKYLLS